MLLSSTLRQVMNMPVAALRMNYPLFYEQLIGTNCLVDEETNESFLLKKRICAIDENPKSYQLTINPTISCNFKCWYCYENHYKTQMEESVLISTKRLIAKIMQNPELEFFNLSFFGGEPLLYYWKIVLPILEHFNLCKKKFPKISTFIHFTTNGYLLNERMITNLKEQQVSSFQITLDGTREEHDQTRFPYKGGKSYDKITRNVIALLQNGFHVTLRLNYTAKNAERMKEIIPLFIRLSNQEKKNLIVDFQQVWQDRDSQNEQNERTQAYIEECIDLFAEQQIMTSHHYHNYVWDSCYADKKNSAVINYNGDVYKCTARDFSTANREGYLSSNGEIIWNLDKYRLRRTIRLSRTECQQCRIAPLCGGACAQKQIERQNNSLSCLLGYTEEIKDQIILDKFYVDIVKPDLQVCK